MMRIGLLLSAAFTVVAAGVTPQDGIDGRISGDALDQVDVIGSLQSEWSVIPTPRVRSLSGEVPPAKPHCPTTRWVLGQYYTQGQFCDGEMGGTNWAILLDDEQEETPADAEPLEEFVVTRQDVQSLLVDSGSLEVQPDRSWVLVNIETIVMTDAEQHVLSTHVLGVDVDVRVTPASFTWDFGDGSPAVVGTDPGAPWPDHTVAHVYQDAQQVSIGLRTEWDAEFRPAGATVWFPVDGRAVTVATSDPIDVVTATPRLTVGR